MISNPSRRVLVCHNRTCRKSGADKILNAFVADRVPEVEVSKAGCLGQCGNGPMVLILPEEIWYWRVNPDEVAMIIEKHIKNNSPITAMLYPKFHKKYCISSRERVLGSQSLT